ncbi:MAG TPA: GNAT family N-acetyltransferase [Anaerolineae bacterium]|nr:GNAT family N-acetyltransferase [Anaerolineae bacterium]
MPFSIVQPMLEEKEEFIWSSFTREDIPEVYRLLDTVNRVDDNDYAETEQDLEQQFEDPWSDPARDARIVRTVRGTLAAWLRVFVNPKPTQEKLAFVFGEIVPEERGKGLEEECVEWMEAHARERLAEIGEAENARALPGVIRTLMPGSAEKAIQLYREHGFEHVRTFYKMQRDLHEPIPDIPLPPGLTLRTYGEDIDEQLREASNEAFRDHWGHLEVTAEEWHPFVIDVSGVRRDLILVVMDGDEVAAYCINRIKANENEQLGIRRGWISELGTRRAWRKRGIASALLCETMRRFRAEGLDWAGLAVDSDSWTNALALYERLGFKTYKTRISLEKRVTSKPDTVHPRFG